jgi:hypothetical protein
MVHCEAVHGIPAIEKAERIEKQISQLLIQMDIGRVFPRRGFISRLWENVDENPAW